MPQLDFFQFLVLPDDTLALQVAHVVYVSDKSLAFPVSMPVNPAFNSFLTRRNTFC